VFALGPHLIDGEEPHEDERYGAVGDLEESQGDGGQEQEEHPDETTALLPDGVYRREQRVEDQVDKKVNSYWKRLLLEPKRCSSSFDLWSTLQQSAL
jgi:hypothetical protein